MRIFMWVLLGAVLVGGLAFALWTALELPPLRIVMEYGFSSSGGPTGRRVTLEGVTFIELSRCCFRMGSDAAHVQSDAIGRLSQEHPRRWSGRFPATG